MNSDKNTMQDVLVHREIVEIFSRLMKKGRLAHAYLLTGSKDIGKTQTALTVVKVLNCQEQNNEYPFACGKCSSCIQIKAGNHPDVHVVVPEKSGTIKIEQIRTVLAQANLRPFSGKWKVFLFKDAHLMSIEGANALLKTLEEPASQTLMLLTATVGEKVLGTIRSRCHVIPVPEESPRILTSQLIETFHVEEGQAHQLSYFSKGSLASALALKEGDFFAFQKEVIERFILGPESETFIKEIQGDKELLKHCLEILCSWVRDAFLLKCNTDRSRLIYQDRIHELDSFAQEYDLERLSSLQNQIIKTLKLLADNLNVKVPLMIIKEMLWEKSYR